MSNTFVPTMAPTSTNLFGSTGTAIIVFIMFGIGLGAATEFTLHLLHFPIPYVAFVFFEGAIISAALQLTVGNETFEEVEETDTASILILYVFLPVLLFGEVMNLNWHHIKGGFNQALILAGPCALACAILTALFTSVIWPGWRQPVLYYVFGGILSATDPVSVVALLKSCEASSKLTIVIVGESLMNDGTAMILFFYFVGTLDGIQYTAGAFFEFVSIKLLASPSVGLAIGALSVFLMKRFYQKWHIMNMSVQIAITLIATYSSFFIAQWPTLIDGSGVLSCCSAGLVVAWMGSPKVINDHTMHEVWGKLEWVCNTLIFLLGGMVAGGKTFQQATLNEFLYAILLYVVLMFIRVAITVIVYPVISSIGLKCSRNDAAFMAFSGLRGALAIALALELKSNSNVTQQDGQQFYLFVCVIAALTLLINGTLAEFVLTSLGLVEDPTKPKSPEMLFVLEQIKRRIRRAVREEIEHMREELGEFDQDEVRRLCRLMRGSSPDDDNYQVVIRDNSKIDPMLLAYVRSTFLETVRARYWDSIHTAKLGTQSFSAQLLLYSIDKAMDLIHDPKSSLGDWECIERNLGGTASMYGLAVWVDSVAQKFNRFPGWAAFVDALTERRAIYVLSNFIDGHLHAQNLIHTFLGAPDKDFGFASPEELLVKADSEKSVARARYLLGMIRPQDVTAFFNHRTAKVVLMLQKQFIEHMVEEGALTNKLANAFLDDIENDGENVEKERESNHKSFLVNTTSRRVAEQKQQRLSEISLRDSITSNDRNSHMASNQNSAIVSPLVRAGGTLESSGSIPIPADNFSARPPTLREMLHSRSTAALEFNESFVSSPSESYAGSPDGGGGRIMLGSIKSKI